MGLNSMAMRLPAIEKSRRRSVILTSLILLTLITVAAALLFDVIDIGVPRPDLYNPGREALVEAQWQLAQTIPHGQTAPVEADQTHQHIRTVLDWLDTAQNVEPEHRQRIAALREMITKLEAADREAQASAQHRRQIYDQIVSELKTLIARYQETPGLREPQ